MISNPQGDRFILQDLWYIPMGEHVPVYNRPYIVNSDIDAINTVVDRKMSKGSAVVDGSILGDLTTRFITPSAQAEVGMIDQNWVTEPKFVFVLKVLATNAIGIETVSYIQGYTNYNGISNTGNADPHLVHHINTIIETNILIMDTPMGTIRKEKLAAIYNVFGHNGQEYFTQRPTDIMANMDMVSLTDTFIDSNVHVQAQTAGNMINPFNDNVVSSAVGNQIPTEYLSTIMNASMHNMTSKDILLNSYEQTDDSVKGQRIIEPSVSDNRFVKYLSALSGRMLISEQFEFQQLMSIDNTIHDRFTLIQLNKSYQDPNMLNTPIVGEYWHGNDPVTVKAYSLIESSVALATKSGFNKLYFTATNMANPTGGIDIVITNFQSFTSLEDRDIAYLLEYFKNKLQLDILVPETNGGTLPIYMEMYVDLIGTSKVNLEFAGFPATWYTIPTSASSLYSPILTFDKAALDTVAIGFHEVTNSLLEEETSRSRTYYPR